MMRLAGMACVLVLLAAVPGPAAAQATPQADLAVDTPAIVGPAPGWTDGIPTHTRFAVTVSNNGDTAAWYRIEYDWVKDGVASPLNGDPETSFNISTEPLGARSDHTHIEDWRLQPGQEGGGALRATVVMLSDQDGEPLAEPGHNNAAQRTLHVYTRGVSVTATGPDLQIEPDGTGFFRVIVRNEGNIPASVALRQAAGIDDPRLSTLIHPDVLEVPAHGARNATFYVSFDPAGDFAPFEGNYTVQADPGFGARPQVISPHVTDAAGGDNTGFDLDLQAPPDVEWSIPAGQQRTVPVLLTNTGSRADNHTFEVLAPAGWETSIAPERVALYAGEHAWLQVTVTAPTDAAAGADGSTVVQALGSRTAHQAVTLPFRAAGPSPTVTGVLLAAEPYVKDRPTVMVTLANPGDESTPPSTLRLDVEAPGVPAQVLSADVSAVAPGTERRLDFTLDPLIAGGTLSLEATWEAPAETGQSTAFLVHAPDFAVVAPEGLSGQPGQTVAYRQDPHAFLITNTGNSAQTVHVEARAGTAEAAVEGDSTFVLEPLQQRTVPVLHRLPADAGQGADGLSLAVSVQGRDRQWIETVETTILDRQPPQLRPDALPEVWTRNETLPLVVRAEDASAVATATATVTAPDGGSTLIDLTHTSGGWIGDVVMTSTGIHTISFAAEDEAGNSASTDPVAVEAAEVPAPRLRILAAPQNVSAGSVLDFKVDDTRPLQHLWVELRQGNVSIELPLPLNATSFRLDGDDLQSGPVEVRITAQNAAGAVGGATISLNWTAQSLDTEPVDKESPSPAAPVLAALLEVLRRRRREAA